MEHNEIIDYITRINQQEQTLNLVNEIENELAIKGETHASVELQLAIILYQNGQEEKSYNKLMYMLNNEVENEYFTFNTIYSDAVGIGSSLLIDKFFKKSSTNYQQLFDLSFIYLTSHIQNFGYQMFNSLNHRAILLESNHNYSRSLGSRFLKSYSFIPIPLFISDYYFSAEGYISSGNMQIGNDNSRRADYLHRFLEDMMIGGKDADDYSLKEMSELGKERMQEIYSEIDTKEILDNFNFNHLTQ